MLARAGQGLAWAGQGSPWLVKAGQGCHRWLAGPLLARLATKHFNDFRNDFKGFPKDLDGFLRISMVFLSISIIF